jgi:hypothetical protein
MTLGDGAWLVDTRRGEATFACLHNIRSWPLPGGFFSRLQILSLPFSPTIASSPTTLSQYACLQHFPCNLSIVLSIPAYELSIAVFPRLCDYRQRPTRDTKARSAGARLAFAMNGHGGPFGQHPAWQEHRTADGRSYYYNSITKLTQWTKPEDLMSPAEVSLVAFAIVSGHALTCRSVRSPTSHGRNIRQKAVASTGTTPRQSRALGRCQRPTSLLSQQLVDPPPLCRLSCGFVPDVR